MRVIAYYTEGTPYEQEISHLEASMIRHNITYTLLGVPSKGSWTANCALKPELILRAMVDLHPDENIFYVDADAEFARFPELFADMERYYSYLVPKWNKTGEILSGSLYFRNCAQSKELLEMWIKMQTDDEWDQKVLARVLNARDWQNGDYLPLEYCKIFDNMDEIEDPVIVHNQASRRFKKVIDG